MRRITDAKPGSAWDTWHEAGWDYVHEHGGHVHDAQIDSAAIVYVKERPSLNQEAILRAFTEGAKQRIKRKEKTPYIDLIKESGERDQITPTVVRLWELISALKIAPQAAAVETDQGGGLSGAHSYRGYYGDLAFEPCDEPVSVEQLLAEATEAVGTTFEGYRGGEYIMGNSTPLWLADYGCCGHEIRSVRLIKETVVIGTEIF